LKKRISTDTSTRAGFMAILLD
jgi:hypothetical protein